MKRVLLFLILPILIFSSCMKTIDLSVKEYPKPELDVHIREIDNYVEGFPINIECRIVNKTRKNQYIYFMEKYRGMTEKTYTELSHAVNFSASIKDSNGNELCKYPCQYTRWSTFMFVEDCHLIVLKPGDKIVRNLDASYVPGMCSCALQMGFKKGKYKIQISVDRLKSNILEIEVKDRGYPYIDTTGR